MTWRGRTGIAVTGATAFLIVWDIIAVLDGGSRATISNLLLGLGYSNPVIPVFLGGLMSHLFWTGPTIGPGWLRVSLGALILGALTPLGLLGVVSEPPAISLAVGFLLGRLLVPQKAPSRPSKELW